MRKAIAVVLALALAVVLVLLLQVTLVRVEDIEERLFGWNLVNAKNVPYGFSALYIGNWSLVVPHYHSLPVVPVDGVSVADLFVQLNALPFVDEQFDPKRVYEDGGNCQSISVYLRTGLDLMGIESGFFIQPEHISVWAVIDDVLYSMDATTGMFSRMSYRDRQMLERFISLEGVN